MYNINILHILHISIVKRNWYIDDSTGILTCWFVNHVHSSLLSPQVVPAAVEEEEWEAGGTGRGFDVCLWQSMGLELLFWSFKTLRVWVRWRGDGGGLCWVRDILFLPTPWSVFRGQQTEEFMVGGADTTNWSWTSIISVQTFIKVSWFFSRTDFCLELLTFWSLLLEKKNLLPLWWRITLYKECINLVCVSLCSNVIFRRPLFKRLSSSCLKWLGVISV